MYLEWQKKPPPPAPFTVMKLLSLWGGHFLIGGNSRLSLPPGPCPATASASNIANVCCHHNHNFSPHNNRFFKFTKYMSIYKIQSVFFFKKKPISLLFDVGWRDFCCSNAYHCYEDTDRMTSYHWSAECKHWLAHGDPWGFSEVLGQQKCNTVAPNYFVRD